MKIEELRKAREAGMSDAIIAYATSYNFESRWTKRDTIIYSFIAAGLGIMAILSLIG